MSTYQGETLPAIGTTIRYTGPTDDVPAWCSNLQGKVVGRDMIIGNRFPLYIDFEAPNGDRSRYWIPMNSWTTSPTLADVMAAAVPEDASKADLLAIIENLTNDLTEEKSRSESREARRAEAQTRLEESQRRYSHDLGWIDTYFRESLKPERDWCDDGYNEVVRRVNSNMEGGFQFTTARSLERKHIDVEGVVTTSIEVWVYDDEDADDTDNWMDSAGDEISDPDALIRDACDEERSRHGWDTLEVQ